MVDLSVGHEICPEGGSVQSASSDAEGSDLQKVSGGDSPQKSEKKPTAADYARFGVSLEPERDACASEAMANKIAALLNKAAAE